VPKLSSDVPNDLLRKKGVADEQLAKLEAERGTNNGDLSHSPIRPSRKRSRSSSSSASSVSTISTNRSTSASPKRTRTTKGYAEDLDKPMFSQQESQLPRFGQKRQRSLTPVSSSGSSASRQSYSKEREYAKHERNTRRRRSSVSPERRGRRSRHERVDHRRRERSRDDSMDRSQIARQRLSKTPDRRGGHQDHGTKDLEGSHNNHDRDRSNDGYGAPRDGYDRGRAHADGPVANGKMGMNRENAPQLRTRPDQVRERSLSPYSKRLALTQAMGAGR
jgi:hypothetical protein